MCLSLGLLRILRNVWVWEGTVVGWQAEDLRLVTKKVTGKLDSEVYIFNFGNSPPPSNLNSFTTKISKKFFSYKMHLNE